VSMPVVRVFGSSALTTGFGSHHFPVEITPLVEVLFMNSFKKLQLLGLANI